MADRDWSELEENVLRQWESNTFLRVYCCKCYVLLNFKIQSWHDHKKAEIYERHIASKLKDVQCVHCLMKET